MKNTQMNKTNKIYANASVLNYLNSYFLSLDKLAQSCRISIEQCIDFMKAGCIPGVIYKSWDNGAFWSTLSVTGQQGTPQGECQDWYTAAAIWWLRRALVYKQNLSFDDVAKRLVDDFRHSFITDLSQRPRPWYAYDNLKKPDGTWQETEVDAVVDSEWASWIGGGYAVCLRRFDAPSLLTKNIERSKILDILERSGDISQSHQIELVNAMARLEAVLLPFSPFERPKGTPGTCIDAVLEAFNLGGEAYHYTEASCAPILDNKGWLSKI